MYYVFLISKKYEKKYWEREKQNLLHKKFLVQQNLFLFSSYFTLFYKVVLVIEIPWRFKIKKKTSISEYETIAIN